MAQNCVRSSAAKQLRHAADSAGARGATQRRRGSTLAPTCARACAPLRARACAHHAHEQRDLCTSTLGLVELGSGERCERATHGCENLVPIDDRTTDIDASSASAQRAPCARLDVHGACNTACAEEQRWRRIVVARHHAFTLSSHVAGVSAAFTRWFTARARHRRSCTRRRVAPPPQRFSGGSVRAPAGSSCASRLTEGPTWCGAPGASAMWPGGLEKRWSTLSLVCGAASAECQATEQPGAAAAQARTHAVHVAQRVLIGGLGLFRRGGHRGRGRAVWAETCPAPFRRGSASWIRLRFGRPLSPARSFACAAPSRRSTARSQSRRRTASWTRVRVGQLLSPARSSAGAAPSRRSTARSQSPSRRRTAPASRCGAGAPPRRAPRAS